MLQWPIACRLRDGRKEHEEEKEEEEEEEDEPEGEEEKRGRGMKDQISLFSFHPVNS